MELSLSCAESRTENYVLTNMKNTCNCGPKSHRYIPYLIQMSPLLGANCMKPYLCLTLQTFFHLNFFVKILKFALQQNDEIQFPEWSRLIMFIHYQMYDEIPDVLTGYT